jgi:hypothetical protein
MAGIASGQVLRLRYDGHAFVPCEPVEFHEGDEMVVRVEQSPITPEERSNREERWRKIKSTFGMWQAPPGFNWDFDRDDLYRDAP